MATSPRQWDSGGVPGAGAGQLGASSGAGLGLASNRLAYRPGSFLAPQDRPRVATRSSAPVLGLGASWQFAERWSLEIDGDWTRAELRTTADGVKRARSVQSLHVGVGFHS